MWAYLHLRCQTLLHCTVSVTLKTQPRGNGSHPYYCNTNLCFRGCCAGRNVYWFGAFKPGSQLRVNLGQSKTWAPKGTVFTSLVWYLLATSPHCAWKTKCRPDGAFSQSSALLQRSLFIEWEMYGRRPLIKYWALFKGPCNFTLPNLFFLLNIALSVLLIWFIVESVHTMGDYLPSSLLVIYPNFGWIRSSVCRLCCSILCVSYCESDTLLLLFIMIKAFIHSTPLLSWHFGANPCYWDD